MAVNVDGENQRVNKQRPSMVTHAQNITAAFIEEVKSRGLRYALCVQMARYDVEWLSRFQLSS